MEECIATSVWQSHQRSLFVFADPTEPRPSEVCVYTLSSRFSTAHGVPTEELGMSPHRCVAPKLFFTGTAGEYEGREASHSQYSVVPVLYFAVYCCTSVRCVCSTAVLTPTSLNFHTCSRLEKSNTSQPVLLLDILLPL